MSLRSLRLPAALLALPLFAVAAGCGGARPAAPPAVDSDGSPIVARWSADTLSLDEFEMAFAQSDGTLADTVADALERRQDFLQRYVDFRLKVLAARQAGYAEDSSYQAEVESYRDQLAGPYFTDREIFDDIVRDIYRKQGEEVQVRHLLVRPRPDTAVARARATAIRDSITAGLLDFETAARRYSEDPSAETNGGDIGYISGGLTVLPFENLTYSTPVGEVAGPVRTDFGYHIIEVLDRRPAQGQIQARHILVRTEGSEPADTLAAYQTIADLRARVEAGEDFADLAREFSDDTGSGARGGDLGTFGTGRMVPSFEAAAFGIEEVGGLAGPVRTRFGYHLIQLTGRVPRPSFDEAYDALKGRAQRLPRTALRREAVAQSYRDSLGSTFDEAVVREALAQVPEDSLTATLLTEGIPAGYGERSFATVGDSVYVLDDLVETFRRTPTRTRMGEAPRPLAEFYVEAADRFVSEQALEQAIRALEDRDAEFRRIFRGYADGVLYFRIAEDSVWTAAKDDEVELRTYYAAHQGDYRYPERRRVLALRSPSDSLLQTVAARLDAGEAARDIVATYDASLPLRLDTVYVADSTRSALDLTLGLEVGGHTGVVAERSRVAIYVLDGIEAPRGKTFEEARAEVATGYQEVLEDRWEARLRARYDAEVFPERIPPAPLRVAPSVPAASPSPR